MKIVNDNNKINIFMLENSLNVNNYNELNSEIKNLFIKLIKKYKLDLFGYLKVTVFHNNICGNYLEIDKLYNSGYKEDIIDLKIIVYKNVPVYLEFDEYPLLAIGKKIKCLNNKYYLEIDNSMDLYQYLEYGKIIYYKNS